MSRPPADEVERRLLGLEEVDEDSVRAVVSGALERARAPRRPHRLRVALACGAVCVVVAAVVAVRWTRAPEAEVAFYQVTMVDSLVVMSKENADSWILGPMDAEGRVAESSGYVLIQGER